jgi:hypothetical protein
MSLEMLKPGLKEGYQDDNYSDDLLPYRRSPKKQKHTHKSSLSSVELPTTDISTPFRTRRTSSLGSLAEMVSTRTSGHNRARWSYEINSLYDANENFGLENVDIDRPTSSASKKSHKRRRRGGDFDTRRVRFNDTGIRFSSSKDGVSNIDGTISSGDEISTDSEDDNVATFVRQDRLSAQLKKMIEDEDEVNDSDAFWRLAADMDVDEESESGSSSGYESMFLLAPFPI